jgi:hypothetical protein
MNRNAKRRSEAVDRGLVIRSEWGTGPRTQAWDLLWRSILEGLDAQPCTDATELRGREDSDG